MSLPALRRRLCFTCSGNRNSNYNTALPPILLGKRVSASQTQRRVLLTTLSSRSGSRFRITSSPRSPHQWSHIAHRIRRLGPLKISGAMGADHARGHAGHSHHHHHDTTYLTSTNKSDPGVRITRIGLYVNLGMAIAKGVGGYVFNSQA